MSKQKNAAKVAVRLIVISVLMAIGVISCVPDTDTTPSSIEGSWTCKETNDKQSPVAYKVNIQFETGSSSKFRIYNFLQLGSAKYVQASLVQNTITIPTQTIDSYEINGSGSVASGSKSITIKHVDCLYGDSIINATSIYSR